jgi:hypothetical protein
LSAGAVKLKLIDQSSLFFDSKNFAPRNSSLKRRFRLHGAQPFVGLHCESRKAGDEIMASENRGSDHRGEVKDPEHDGRLKENREAGRTKGTTPGSEARAREHGKDDGGQSRGQSHAQGRGGSGEQGGQSREKSQGAESSGKRAGGSDDLKSREYKDEKGEVHHHTRSYMEQHER